MEGDGRTSGEVMVHDGAGGTTRMCYINKNLRELPKREGAQAGAVDTSYVVVLARPWLVFDLKPTVII